MTKIWFWIVGSDEVHERRHTDSEVEKLKQVLDWETGDPTGNYPNDNHVVFTLQPELVRYKRSSNSPAMCAYEASKSYMSNIFGITLDSTDRTWYQNVPIMNPGGLPKAHTITVINELLRPYGIGVKKVYYRKNSVSYDEVKIWKEVLGCNPLAYSDNTVSNQDYINMTITADTPEIVRQMTLEDSKHWGIEYVDQLPEGCIIGFSGADASFASGGGHATYYAPRAKNPSDWQMAITLDRIENIKYHKPVPVYNLEEKVQLNPDFDEYPVTLNGKTGSIRAYVNDYHPFFTQKSYTGMYGGSGYSPKKTILRSKSEIAGVIKSKELVSQFENFLKKQFNIDDPWAMADEEYLYDYDSVRDAISVANEIYNKNEIYLKLDKSGVSDIKTLKYRYNDLSGLKSQILFGLKNKCFSNTELFFIMHEFGTSKYRDIFGDYFVNIIATELPSTMIVL